VSNGGAAGPQLLQAVRRALGERAVVSPVVGEDAGRFAVALAPGVVLGDALGALTSESLTLLGCREERPGIEHAFLKIAGAGER
jgi:hypothetical protein